MRIMKKNMETTIVGLYRVWGFGFGVIRIMEKKKETTTMGYMDNRVCTLYKGYISFSLFFSSL